MNDRIDDRQCLIDFESRRLRKISFEIVAGQLLVRGRAQLRRHLGDLNQRSEFDIFGSCEFERAPVGVFDCNATSH